MLLLSRSVAEPEAMPQAFDPKLYAQLPRQPFHPSGRGSVQTFQHPPPFPPPVQKIEDNPAQLVSGSTADPLPGLHPQATLRNSLLDLTCSKFTSSSAPGRVSPAAPCWCEGTMPGDHSLFVAIARQGHPFAPFHTVVEEV